MYHAPPDVSPTSWTGQAATTATTALVAGSSSTNRRSCCAATSTSRRSRPTATGSIASVDACVQRGSPAGTAPDPHRARHRDGSGPCVVARSPGSRSNRSRPREPSTRARDRAPTRAAARVRRSHQASEHDVDHAQTPFVIGVLLLEVGEIRRHQVQPNGKERASASEQRGSTRAARAHRRPPRRSTLPSPHDIGGRRDVEQQRHLAHARTGVGHRRDRRSGLLDPQPPFDEHIQRTHGPSVDEQHFTEIDHAARTTVRDLEQVRHVHSLAHHEIARRPLGATTRPACRAARTLDGAMPRWISIIGARSSAPGRSARRRSPAPSDSRPPCVASTAADYKPAHRGI